MKNLLTALLPAIGLLALGGCASTSAVTSSEDDGVYYSSKDHTRAIVSAAPAPASTDEAANPDYHGGTARTAPRSSGSDQYYDNTYTYMRGASGYGPGLSYYAPYSPYTTLSYGVSSYGFGYGGGAYGFSPYPCLPPVYGYGYDPFYSPFGYGYGSGVSITFGVGRPWGYGGGYYGRPSYGYGYGGGFYDPYYYGGPFYSGYYGHGGYYGNNYGGNYYGGNNSYNNNTYYSGHDDGGRGRTSGHRTDRSSEGRSPGAVAGGGSTGISPNAPVPNGRVRSDMRAEPAPNMPTTQGVTAIEGGRVRTEAVSATPGTAAEQPTRGGFNRPRGIDRGSEEPRYRNMDQQLPASAGREPLDPSQGQSQGQVSREADRGRWRNTDAAPQGADQSQPEATPQPQEGRRRGGFFQSTPSQPDNNGDQSRQRTYEQPQQQRTYEQPQRQQQQRVYEQPQQRSYEQPQRSEPSYSAPSNGGGNSGGGGGGGGRSRGRGE